MFASSSGASISSSRQNGLGLYLKMANISAIAVSAFSPPESSCTLCSRLPGGDATMSMPLSSGSFSSSSVRPARPPPNSVLNISWKLLLIAANASRKRALRRLVDALDRLAGLRRSNRPGPCAAWSGTVARLELVELLDRHHVDRAEPIDLRLAGSAMRLFGGHAGAARRRPRRRIGRSGVGVGDLAILVPLSVRFLGREGARVRHGRRRRAPSARLRRAPRRARPARRRRTTARGARGRLSAVARATSSSAASARTSSSARARVADGRFMGVGVRAQRRRVSLRRAAVRAAPRARGYPSSSARAPSAIASSSPARSRSSRRARRRELRRRAARARGRASSSRCTSAVKRPGALDQRGERGLRFGRAMRDALAASRGRQTAGAAPCSTARRPRAVPARAGRSTRALRAAAHRARRAAPRRAGARARAAPPCAQSPSRPRPPAPAAPRARRWPSRRDAGRRCSAAIARRLHDPVSSARRRDGQIAPASRSAPMRSRSSLISRLVPRILAPRPSRRRRPDAAPRTTSPVERRDTATPCRERRRGLLVRVRDPGLARAPLDRRMRTGPVAHDDLRDGDLRPGAGAPCRSSTPLRSATLERRRSRSGRRSPPAPAQARLRLFVALGR